MKKSTLIIVVIIAAILGGLYAYINIKPDDEISYATEPVMRADIEKTVLANGMLQASKLVNVGAQVSGQITTLAVELGDQVKKGDLIAQIDDLTQQNTLKEAQASLNSINAQFRAKNAQIKQSTLELKRQRQMYADNATSKMELDIAEADLIVLKAELDQLEAQKQQALITVDTAKVDLGYTTILAPIDGTVVYTAVEAGQTVNANQTTPTIIELAQLDVMTVEAQISEADVIYVKPGQAVYFTILGQPDRRYPAKLRAIEPGPTLMTGDDSNLTASDSDAIYFNGLFDIANPKNILRIGMTAEVSIVLEQAKDTLLVPSQVVKRKGPKYEVPVLENGKVVDREVTVGINNKINTQILTGLTEKDKIVLGMATAGQPVSNRRPPKMRF